MKGSARAYHTKRPPYPPNAPIPTQSATLSQKEFLVCCTRRKKAQREGELAKERVRQHHIQESLKRCGALLHQLRRVAAEISAQAALRKILKNYTLQLGDAANGFTQRFEIAIAPRNAVAHLAGCAQSQEKVSFAK